MNVLSTKESQQLQRGAVSVDVKFQPIQQQLPFGGGGGQAFCSGWTAGGGFVGGRCMVGRVEWLLGFALPPAISLASDNRVVATLVLGLSAID